MGLYFTLWPVNIDPVAWNPAPPPSMETGDFQRNKDLASVKMLATSGKAPEDVAIDAKGMIYGGLLDGRIIRMQADGSQEEDFANTEGRPLGLIFDPQGNLIVGDAFKGLLSINPEGEIEVLAKSHDDREFLFTDDLDIDEAGIIYFTDASEKFTFHDHIDYPLESGLHGRLLSYNLQNKEIKLLMDDLAFANGVAVDKSQEFVLVNETMRYRVHRYWLKGPKAGTSEVFLDNLPGFPDGILQDEKGIFWVALVTPRNKLLDQLAPQPYWRKVLRRIPEALLPSPEDYGFIIGVDGQGKVIYNLQAPDGEFGQITNVVSHQGKLYLGSLEEHGIGVIDRPN